MCIRELHEFLVSEDIIDIGTPLASALRTLELQGPSLGKFWDYKKNGAFRVYLAKKLNSLK